MRLQTPRFALVLPVLCLVLSAGSAPAADLYLNGQFTVAGNTFESGGFTTTNPSDPTDPAFHFANRGDDSDSAWVLGGAFGYAVAFNEMAPLDWDWPLADWTVRFELEAKGGGDTEYITQGLDPYISTVSTWQLMNNFWLDVPLDAPVRWALGRVPWLAPLTFQAGAGIGLSSTEIETTNNTFSGSTDGYGFAWQAGAGFGYRLTDRVTLGLGYRYLDLGNHSFQLGSGSFPDPLGTMEVDLVSHELNFGIRVAFLDVASPGEWSLESRNRDWSWANPRNWFKRN
jgi:opacity protein-like surface antigen